jgi:hypothetical protein
MTLHFLLFLRRYLKKVCVSGTCITELAFIFTFAKIIMPVEYDSFKSFQAGRIGGHFI